MLPATCKNEAWRNIEVNNGRIAVASRIVGVPGKHRQRVVRNHAKLDHD